MPITAARRTKKVKKYDWHRDPNGKNRSKAELFLLLICVLCIPNFNLDKHSYSYFKENRKDRYGPINWSIQRQIDFMTTMREEGFFAIAELEDATKEAAKIYGKTKRKLVEMNAKIELNKYLYYSIETYLDVVPQIHKLIKSGMDLKTLKKKHGDLVSRYEDSVRHMRMYTANSWQSLDDIICEYKEIQELRPVLLQTVAAQYEHYRRLALANETAVLKHYADLPNEKINNYVYNLKKNPDAFTNGKKTVTSAQINSTPPNPQQNTDTSVLRNAPTPSSALLHDEPNSLKNPEKPVSQSTNEVSPLSSFFDPPPQVFRNFFRAKPKKEPHSKKAESVPQKEPALSPKFMAPESNFQEDPEKPASNPKDEADNHQLSSQNLPLQGIQDQAEIKPEKKPHSKKAEFVPQEEAPLSSEIMPRESNSQENPEKSEFMSFDLLFQDANDRSIANRRKKNDLIKTNLTKTKEKTSEKEP